MTPTSRLARSVLALTLVATACASTQPAVPVSAGSRVMVRLYDAKHGFKLALANESHPELQDVYSRERTDGALKLAPDQLMGELLASLETTAMDRFGSVDARPDDDVGYLSVQHDGVRRVFPAPGRNATGDERQAWARIKLLMDHYYQHVGGLQYVSNPDGGALFRGDR